MTGYFWILLASLVVEISRKHRDIDRLIVGRVAAFAYRPRNALYGPSADPSALSQLPIGFFDDLIKAVAQQPARHDTEQPFPIGLLFQSAERPGDAA
jgi:hypothetical protein